MIKAFSHSLGQEQTCVIPAKPALACRSPGAGIQSFIKGLLCAKSEPFRHSRTPPGINSGE